MKRSHLQVIGAAAMVVLAVASVSSAAITNINNNAVDMVGDMGYDGSMLSFSSSDMSGQSNLLSVYQDDVLITDWISAGAYGVDLYMETNFVDFNQSLTDPTRAYFTEGYLDLKFIYDDWTTPQDCRLGGRITEGSMEAVLDGGQTVFTGVFLFDTKDATYGYEVMPDGDVWPAANLSAAVTLSWVMGGDMTDFDWSTQFPSDNATDTIFDFVPTEVPIPEPASLLLALAGLPLMLRRRSN